MGMYISAKLIYGCGYSELPEEILDEVNELLDSGELDYASPYYDSSRSDWIIGVRIRVNGKTCGDAGYQVQAADDEIPEILIRDDLKLAVYVSPDVI